MGYTPTRFIQVTGDGNVPELDKVCTGLIMSQKALQWLEEDLRKLPQFLTIEDFVSRWGNEWGFSQIVIQEAKARSKYLIC